ncbi:MAG: hypothetical protein M1168_02975 [Candidatus Marsarchaeota archaeon]|nr:hypothetical protein [Candidatus Marsarchaeota archaeon]MCL5094917.1 hypothetical protein [Candidatus Marsarchaeota archaeon]
MVHKLFTLNIRKYLVTQPRNKRRNKAIKYIRERISHFTKTPIENVKIAQPLNAAIQTYYAKKMNKIKLDANIENNNVLLTHVSEAKNIVIKENKKFKEYEKLISKTTGAQNKKAEKTELKKK